MHFRVCFPTTLVVGKARQFLWKSGVLQSTYSVWVCALSHTRSEGGLIRRSRQNAREQKSGGYGPIFATELARACSVLFEQG